MGPTFYDGIIQDAFNTKKNIDTAWIYQHIEAANQWGCKNMLIIFDDVLGAMKGSSSPDFIDLFYNRRHLLTDGTVSIIVTGQKWNLIPTFVRQAINMLFLFPLAKAQLETIIK